jgi:hypothetical protein
MEDIFFKIICNRDLFSQIKKYQHGRTWKNRKNIPNKYFLIHNEYWNLFFALNARYSIVTRGDMFHLMKQSCNMEKVKILDEMITLKRKKRLPYTARVMDNAVYDIEIVKFLHSLGCKCTVSAMNNAAKIGCLETLQWLHENRTEGCTKRAMDKAALNGHLDVIIYLHQNRTEGCTDQAMDNAARNGHLKVLEWLHVNKTEGCSKFAIGEVIRSNHVETAQWLHKNRKEVPQSGHEGELRCAINNNNLELVKWVLEIRYNSYLSALYISIELGKLDIVKWLLQNSHHSFTRISPDVIRKAIKNGHNDIIQWIQANSTIKGNLVNQ